MCLSLCLSHSASLACCTRVKLSSSAIRRRFRYHRTEPRTYPSVSDLHSASAGDSDSTRYRGKAGPRFLFPEGGLQDEIRCRTAHLLYPLQHSTDCAVHYRMVNRHWIRSEFWGSFAELDPSATVKSASIHEMLSWRLPQCTCERWVCAVCLELLEILCCVKIHDRAVEAS